MVRSSRMERLPRSTAEATAAEAVAAAGAALAAAPLAAAPLLLPLPLLAPGLAAKGSSPAAAFARRATMSACNTEKHAQQKHGG
jgi:hypothetical protein